MKDDVFIEESYSSTPDYVTERNKPMPSLNHGTVQANILFLMKLNYKKTYRTVSELSLDLSDWISVPDVSLIPFKKYDATNDQIKVQEPPLCAIEILSPTQAQSELLIKARNYFEKGVKSCWIVFPELENVYVFSAATKYEIFRKGQTLVDAKMDIQLNVNEIFE